jgi:hypothetical protein
VLPARWPRAAGFDAGKVIEIVLMRDWNHWNRVTVPAITTTEIVLAFHISCKTFGEI